MRILQIVKGVRLIDGIERDGSVEVVGLPMCSDMRCAKVRVDNLMLM